MRIPLVWSAQRGHPRVLAWAPPTERNKRLRVPSPFRRCTEKQRFSGNVLLLVRPKKRRRKRPERGVSPSPAFLGTVDAFGKGGSPKDSSNRGDVKVTGPLKGPSGVIMKTQCGEILKRLDDYRDDRLERPEKTAVEQHLHYCEECLLHWVLLRVRRNQEPCRV